MSEVVKFEEYVEKARTTAIYKEVNSWDGLNYTITGLAGEIGEVFNIFQKCMRDDGWIVNEKKFIKFVGEFGGCEWFLSQMYKEVVFLMSELGLDYTPDVMTRTIEDIAKSGRSVVDGYMEEVMEEAEDMDTLEGEEYIEKKKFRFARQAMAGIYTEIGDVFEVFDAFDDNMSQYDDEERIEMLKGFDSSMFFILISLAATMEFFDISMSKVCNDNLDLLAARLQANTISGSGDGVEDRTE